MGDRPFERTVKEMTIRTTSTSARACIAACALLAAASHHALAGEPGYCVQPALHGNRVVFVSEGDLFTADISNANDRIIAHRLTSHGGTEGRPSISPDGTTIAFAAQYDGNIDVYIMPITGGAPKRLTFHPGPDIALGFSPGGREVLFRSGRMHHFGRDELWRVSTDGGMPERYDFGECSMAALNTSGKVIAFTRWSNEYWTWKDYRGGTAPDIWIGEFASNRFLNLTSNDASDLFPMWVGGRVYFLSDRDGHQNIWSDAPLGGDLKQNTRFAFDDSSPTAIEGYDIRWPSADAAPGGTRIVFSQGGGLAILETANDSVTRLPIELASDRIGARARFPQENRDPAEFALSPDGSKIILGVRGELIEGDVKSERLKRITRTGARERGAAYVDEDTIVYITDSPGEQQIAIRLANGEERFLTLDREDWLMPPTVSPDGTLLAFADKTARLHVIDVTTTNRDIVDRSDAAEITDYAFSPDSQWIAYVKPMPNGFGRVFLYSVRTKRTFPISTGLHNESSPRWDPKGQYLFYLAQAMFNPLLDDLDFEYILKRSVCTFAVTLSSDTPPPVAETARNAGFDLEEWANPESDVGVNETAVAADEGARGPMRIDTDGIESRHFMLPLEAGNYTDLAAVYGGALVLEQPVEGLLDEVWPPPPPGAGNGRLLRVDLVKGEASPFADKVGAFVLSRDCAAIAIPTEQGVLVRPVAGEDEGVTLNPGSLPLEIDIASEWSQILDEAWRLQRDFYWASNMAGVNWSAMREKYRALLPRVATRNELNDVIGEMIGELGTSHTYVWGGDPHEAAAPVNVGMLGAEIAFSNGAFRISSVLPSRPWNEAIESPLAAPHLKVQPGTVIHAINGVELPRGANIYETLQGQAGRSVTLEISDDGANRRTIVVQAIPDDAPLRYAAWVERNRRYVLEKSGGRLGYLHIPDMDGAGLSAFSRLFYPQTDKRGMVIDVRNNGGGFVSQMIIERVARKVWAFMQPRHGVTEKFPARALHGHLAVIIDQHAGSDGDIFPESFRMNELGPLIGARTWGGVIGIRGDKPFVDMGISSQPEFAWWDAQRGWSLENRGVEPDIAVDITPRDRQTGSDPQLDRAIEELLEQLETDPMEPPQPPALPDRR